MKEPIESGAVAAPKGRYDEPHPYTVDVWLHGAEPYPCTICGQGRNNPLHNNLGGCVVKEL